MQSAEGPSAEGAEQLPPPVDSSPSMPRPGPAARSRSRRGALLALQAFTEPLIAENGRLIDQVRNQAIELGMLRERVRILEAALALQAADAKKEPHAHRACTLGR